MAFKEKLKRYQNRTEEGIDRFVPASSTRPDRLHAAMRYSIEAGGKRIRPVLLLAAHDLYGSGVDPLAAAVALECIHTYSLIHDDLPSVDNSDLRRGRPSCHRQFDEPTALLAGDALLTHAFALIAESYRESPGLAVELLRDLGTAAGSLHLIGGQMEDILNEGEPVDADTLQYIHENKTAALITAAVVMGLRFSEPESARVEIARRAGRHLGLAFQILDDILDATSDAATMGKPVGNDAAADKSTYVALHGIAGARDEATGHTRRAIDAFNELGGETEFLVDLTQELGRRIN